MPKIRWMWLLAALLTSVCVAQDTVPRVAFCDLVSAPAKFEGRNVEIEAIVSAYFEGLTMYAEPCYRPDIDVSTEVVMPDGWLTTSLGKKLDKLHGRRRAAQVRLIGRLETGSQRFGAGRARFLFSVAQVLSVREAKPVATTMRHAAR